MKHKEKIDAILDDRKKGYALAWLEKSHGYGHMNMVIHLPAVREYGYRPDAVLKVTCQIGGDHESSRKPYAIKWGLETRFQNSPMPLEDVEAFAKMMRKIERKLDQMNESIGYSDQHSELCQRVLIASGIKDLIVEPEYWVGYAFNITHQMLLKAGSAEAMLWLIKAEKKLIEAFN